MLISTAQILSLNQPFTSLAVAQAVEQVIYWSEGLWFDPGSSSLHAKYPWAWY